MTTTTFTVDPNGLMLLEQRTKPWPGCGFNNKMTEVRVRPGSDGEAHLELMIVEWRGKSDRRFEALSSFTIPAAMLPLFVTALGAKR